MKTKERALRLRVMVPIRNKGIRNRGCNGSSYIQKSGNRAMVNGARGSSKPKRK